MPEAADAEARLRALLHDLDELSTYLHGRGQQSYTLAQRFLDHARQEKDQKTREYDEQQAKMLDYQHYIWHEIAGLVEKLSAPYRGEAGDMADEGAPGTDAGRVQRAKPQTAN